MLDMNFYIFIVKKTSQHRHLKIIKIFVVQRVWRSGDSWRVGGQALPHLLPCWAGLHPPPQPRPVRLLCGGTSGHCPTWYPCNHRQGIHGFNMIHFLDVGFMKKLENIKFVWITIFKDYSQGFAKTRKAFLLKLNLHFLESRLIFRSPNKNIFFFFFIHFAIIFFELQ